MATAGGFWVAAGAQWRTQDLSALEPVYVWADGIYVKAGLESAYFGDVDHSFRT